VTRFVRDALAFIPGGWNQVLVNVLSALVYGYSAQERIYEEKDLGEWKGKMLLTRVQSLKPHFIDFVSDPYGKLTGVTQQMTSTVGDPLPPAKFILYAHAMEFGNYYGVSDLESAYRPWWTKDSAYKWLAITLERYGMSPLFALYDPNSYQGGAVEELKKVVKGIQNATLGVIPRSTKESLEFWSQDLNRGSSDIFLKALDRFDQHIARAILVPDLVGMSSNTGQTGSLARSQTNADSFMQVVKQLQASLADAVMNAQVIPQLCDLNFPNLQSYPLFKFMPFTDDQRLEILNTWAAMVGGQVVNKIEDDEVHIRKVMGFPENEDPKVIEAPPPVQPGVGVDAEGKPIKMGADGQPLKLGPDGRPWKAPLAPGEKKLNPFEKKFDQEGRHGGWNYPGDDVPDTDLSEEMRAFAEEHDAVWMYGEDGRRVAVSNEEVTV
jgi:phage gp29-like protein